MIWYDLDGAIIRLFKGGATKRKERNMFDDLQPDQRIIGYDESGIFYEGRFGDADEDTLKELSMADFYLLDKIEDFDVIAICY